VKLEPGGAQTRVPLFRGVGTVPGPNFGNASSDTVFDDAAPLSISQGAPPYVGRFSPLGTLGSLSTRLGAGRYLLEITNAATTQASTLNRWSLTFVQQPVPGTGLGEPVADRTSAAFRIFTMDPSNPLASTTWTSVGPAANNFHGNSGRIGGISWILLTGLPAGHSLIQDGTGDVAAGTPVPVTAPAQTPSGAKGRIVLAKPALTGNPT
jgi:hypothetical protein